MLTVLALQGIINRNSPQYEVDPERRSLSHMESVVGQLGKRALVLVTDKVDTKHPREKLFSPAFEDWSLGEIFSLVGTADQNFQEWLAQQKKSFTAEVAEILPRVKKEHRLWLGQWLSAKESSALRQAIHTFLGYA